MSSQTVVTTSSSRAPGSSLARKKSLTKYVANKRMHRQASLSSKRKADVVRLPRGFGQTILPERYITTLESSLQFYLGAANLDQTNGNWTDICVNSIYAPFNTTYPVTAVASLYSMNGTLVQGYNIADRPIGYSQMANTYERYKVLGYKLKVSLMTSTNSDVLEMAVTPLGSDEIIANGVAANVNMRVMKGQPKAKSRLCHNGGPNNIIIQKGSVYELLGFKKSQWENMPSTLCAATPDNPAYVGLYLQSSTGSTNNQPIGVTVTMYQIVEFSDINNTNYTA